MRTHMGAIPGPLRADSREIFENNVLSTFNVMTAAAEKGLRRVDDPGARANR